MQKKITEQRQDSMQVQGANGFAVYCSYQIWSTAAAADLPLLCCTPIVRPKYLFREVLILLLYGYRPQTVRREITNKNIYTSIFKVNQAR